MTEQPAPRRSRAPHRLLAGTAATAALALVATAAAADTLPWEGERAKGENQPYQHGYNPDQLLDWDPTTDPHAEQLRSRVPLQARAEPHAPTQRNPDLPAETEMLALSGDYGNAFFESHPYTNVFAQHLFSFWQYTDYYASWHGMASQGMPEELYDPEAEWTQRWFEFGMLNLPNPGYTDAAHRNGVLSLGTIFFSDNDRGSQDYSEILVRDEDGSFPAVAKLVEIAEYFGFDGYFINQEQGRVDPEDIGVYQDFLLELRQSGVYVQWYDSVHAETGETLYENAFTELNSPFVRNAERGDLAHSIFLNYWWDHEMLAESAEYAESLGLDPLSTVFAGLEAGMYQFDQPYDLRDNLDEDGAPMNAIATLGADFVHFDYEHKTENDMQWEAFDRERRWWTGTETGAESPAEDDWQGMNSYIAERNAITGSTFSTTFNTGHGLGYWRDGELVSEAEWGNITIQDLPVTWQWWLEGDGAEALQVDYDYGPEYVPAERFDYAQLGAFEGGSSLAIGGELDGEAVLRLFQTELEVGAESSLELTYAQPAGEDVDLSVALVLDSAPEEVVQRPVETDGQETGSWRTAVVDLADLAGETISTLGVALETESAADVQVNLGQLTVRDGAEQAPAAPSGLEIDRALAASDELFVRWDLDDYDTVQRYDLYADGEYLGGTYDEVLYVKNFDRWTTTLELYAIGHDGSASEPAVVQYDVSGGPGAVHTEAGDDGELLISWDQELSAPATVSVQAEYAGAEPFQTELTAAAGSVSVTVEDVPVDGGHVRVTVHPQEGTPVSAMGRFADFEIEPYPESFAQLDGDTLQLRRPALHDWSTLTVLEDGEPLMFDTTYSQGERPEMIRGRTDLGSLTQELSSSESEVVAIIRDYAGNEAETVLREGDVEPEPTPDPEPSPEPDPEPSPEPAPGAGPEPDPEPSPDPAEEASLGGGGGAAPGNDLPQTGAPVTALMVAAAALIGLGATLRLRGRLRA